MNRNATRIGGNSMPRVRKTFAPMREMPTIKSSTPSCRMPVPLERSRKRRHGLPDILEDIKVY